MVHSAFFFVIYGEITLYNILSSYPGLINSAIQNTSIIQTFFCNINEIPSWTHNSLCLKTVNQERTVILRMQNGAFSTRRDDFGFGFFNSIPLESPEKDGHIRQILRECFVVFQS